jgi:hypothetical protein
MWRVLVGDSRLRFARVVRPHSAIPSPTPLDPAQQAPALCLIWRKLQDVVRQPANHKWMRSTSGAHAPALVTLPRSPHTSQPMLPPPRHKRHAIAHREQGERPQPAIGSARECPGPRRTEVATAARPPGLEPGRGPRGRRQPPPALPPPGPPGSGARGAPGPRLHGPRARSAAACAAAQGVWRLPGHGASTALHGWSPYCRRSLYSCPV